MFSLAISIYHQMQFSVFVQLNCCLCLILHYSQQRAADILIRHHLGWLTFNLATIFILICHCMCQVHLVHFLYSLLLGLAHYFSIAQYCSYCAVTQGQASTQQVSPINVNALSYYWWCFLVNVLAFSSTIVPRCIAYNSFYQVGWHSNTELIQHYQPFSSTPVLVSISSKLDSNSPNTSNV